MPKIEAPSSLTLFIQWDRYPFSTPQISEHKRKNTEWAVAETKQVLDTVLQQFPELKIVSESNGRVQVIIPDPETICENDNTLWNQVLFLLQKVEKVECITVYVNNDISHKIAINKVDYVPDPFNKGYQGFNKETIVYHKL